ncbi:hypothetical protein E4Z66_01525 [Aliishimia ponticola]|uniref:Uncharacterized protein n=1 Tax=Aliishimia ponticola TaxID=2499833 RepID=A0A4S4NPZ4_9RHOB|nr:hypothetical protein [Aliishimia ponticola]THH38280.1 hypothetical protein E4Z66_01525 [Aliishimia ponticola]
MSGKDEFAERLARIAAQQQMPAAPDGPAPHAPRSADDGPALKPRRPWMVLLSITAGLALIGLAAHLTLAHLERGTPGIRAAIAEGITGGKGFNPLEFIAKSTVGDDRWNESQSVPLESRYLNKDGTSKLSDTGRFILNN